MALHFPEVEIDADSVVTTEVMHRSELQVDWAIIGLGRSGTTSLAAWLDSHPRLQLIYEEGDLFREGSFDYLFLASKWNKFRFFGHAEVYVMEYILQYWKEQLMCNQINQILDSPNLCCTWFSAFWTLPIHFTLHPAQLNLPHPAHTCMQESL